MNILGKKISKKIEDMFFWYWIRYKHNKIDWIAKAVKRKNMANAEFYELALFYWKEGFIRGKIEQKGINRQKHTENNG